MQKIAVVGPFACGKTELVTELARRLNCSVVPEPVEEWQKSGFLQAQYDDEAKYSLPFQQYAFSSRILACFRAPEDRCIFDSHVVVDPLYMRTKVRLGTVSQRDFDFYKLTYDNWKEFAPYAKPDLVIYLRCSPETCMTRKAKRDRVEEKDIPTQYFDALNAEFEDEFGDDPNVVVVDAEQGMDGVLEQALRAIRV